MPARTLLWSLIGLTVWRAGGIPPNTRFVTQVDVGDIGHPELVWPRNFQVLDEDGVARKAADAFIVHRPVEVTHHGGERCPWLLGAGHDSGEE
ncbi:MAG TPA: hypothetical protein VGZ25_14835 [Gemmataceae bacterium]|nr:hypothetical protein [Gemmataceae bacterium]